MEKNSLTIIMQLMLFYWVHVLWGQRPCLSCLSIYPQTLHKALTHRVHIYWTECSGPCIILLKCVQAEYMAIMRVLGGEAGAGRSSEEAGINSVDKIHFSQNGSMWSSTNKHFIWLWFLYILMCWSSREKSWPEWQILLILFCFG